MNRHLVIIALILVGLSPMRAQQGAFLTKLLQSLAKSISFVPSDTLSAGSYDAGTALGMPLTVEYDNRHSVTHLGFRLFAPEMKQQYASDVYNFLERYMFELYCWKEPTSLQQKLKDDKVMFTQGTIADIKKINESSAVSIERVENKYYEVTWSNDGQAFLSVAFPIQFELLLGMPQVEIEQKMYDMIKGASAFEESALPQMEQITDSLYRSVPSKHYELESVNTCSYYYKHADGTYSLVLDTLHQDLSATNIFHVMTSCANPIAVTQSLYGFKSREYTISLQQWLQHCHEAELTIYTAIEEEYDDGYKVLIVAESTDMGYNHLLSVIVPKGFLQKPTVLLKAKLNAFIPTHNVKNLYQQYTTKKKKIRY